MSGEGGEGAHPFSGRRTRVLGMEEVRRLLDMREVIEIQRRAFVAHATGEAVAARNTWLRLPEGGIRGWLKLLAGYDPSTSALGVKILARFPDNPSGANLGSVVLLFDDRNGFPLAIMDGVYLTAVRTGAGAGLATERLARPDASTVGVVGTGVVAWYSLLAMTSVRPGLRTARVFSRSAERRRALADRLARELRLEAEAVATVEEAVDGADVVVTGTNSPQPVLHERHLRPGVLVNAMGIRTEVAPEAVRASFVVADGREESLHEGKFSEAVKAGVVDASDLGPEIGDILAGRAEVPPPHRGPVLFDSSGVAIQDVDAARLAWERAEAEGVGTLVDLGLEGTP